MKKGFSVFELLIVMAISAMLMTAIFQIYNQIVSNAVRVDRFVFQDTQMLTLHDRLAKDLAGLSAIWFTQEKLQIAIADEKKSAQSDRPDNKKEESRFFYSNNKQDNLDVITFITTTALQSYGAACDKFVRIVYKVEKDPAHEKLFRLMRKEITSPCESIDEKSMSSGRFYELVHGIKSISVLYYILDKLPSKEGDTQDAKNKNTDEPTYALRQVKTLGTIDSKPEHNKVDKKNIKNDDQENQSDAKIPLFIEMKIMFAATDNSSEQEYKASWSVPSMIDIDLKNGWMYKKAPKEQNES